MSLFLVMQSFIAGVFGAIVGSFLNVLIYRLPRESLSVNKPVRSFCPSCGTALPWYDNLPVLSYMLLGGKCRHCGTGISLRYPLVEAMTFALFACLVLVKDPELTGAGIGRFEQLCIYVIYFFVLAALIAVTFIDLEFQIIPDEITYTGSLVAPLVCAIFPFFQQDSVAFPTSIEPHLAGLISSLAGALLGGGTLYAVGWLGKAILKREALGMGDVKLMIFVGGMFGVEGVLLVFFLGCALGSIVGVPLRAITGKREIPFGPFLSFGVLLVMFFETQLMNFILVTWPEWSKSLF
jgi:leader peptidase (prepilin peptidase)/N-methyltransferase